MNKKYIWYEFSTRAKRHHCFGALSEVDEDHSHASDLHGIVVESGSVDQNCHEVCKIKGYSGCSDEAMPQINSCDILQRAFSCSVSCSVSILNFTFSNRQTYMYIIWTLVRDAVVRGRRSAGLYWTPNFISSRNLRRWVLDMARFSVCYLVT